MTRLVRVDASPLWERVRRALSAMGVDLDRSALVESLERDDGSVFGVVFTQTGQVREFSLAAGVEGLAEWHDITERWRASPSFEAIEDAFFLNVRYEAGK